MFVKTLSSCCLAASKTTTLAHWTWGSDWQKRDSNACSTCPQHWAPAPSDVPLAVHVTGSAALAAPLQPLPRFPAQSASQVKKTQRQVSDSRCFYRIAWSSFTVGQTSDSKHRLHFVNAFQGKRNKVYRSVFIVVLYTFAYGFFIQINKKLRSAFGTGTIQFLFKA